MEIFLLFSVLIIPVVLLASPIPVFTIKGRPDVAVYYLFSLVIVQLSIVATHWGEMTKAAGWVMVLVGLAYSIGCLFTWYKSQVSQWLTYVIGSLIVNALLIVLSYQFLSLNLM